MRDLETDFEKFLSNQGSESKEDIGRVIGLLYASGFAGYYVMSLKVAFDNVAQATTIMLNKLSRLKELYSSAAHFGPDEAQDAEIKELHNWFKEKQITIPELL